MNNKEEFKNKANFIFNKEETRKTIRENKDFIGDSDQMPVEIKKPRQEQWIKVRGKTIDDLPWRDLVYLTDTDTQMEVAWILSGDENTRLKLKNIFDGATRPTILAPCIDQAGNEFVWLVKQSTKGMKEHQAHTSAKAAIQNAQKGWRKIYWKAGTGYVSLKPVDDNSIEDQKFDDSRSIEEVCFAAFDGKMIESLDHTQVKIFRGQKL